MTESDFLAGILAAPLELERWLILSDWLEDQADPRAELARLRYLLHSEPDHPESKERLARQMHLLDSGLAPIVPIWTNRLGIPFALMLPGTFLMGSPEGEAGRLSSETLHRVTLTQPFLLSVYPVTVDEFRPFAQTTGHRSSAEERNDETSWHAPGFIQNGRHPAVCVSWDDSQALCTWLNETDPNQARYALPTEAQWEYGCRSGSSAAFFWGNDAERLGEFGWSLQNSGSASHSVDTGRPSPWGLYHMHGMVWEWCEDVYSTLPEDEAIDPLILRQDTENEPYLRLSRGGSFDHHASVCRSACRGFDEPHDSHTFDGIRLAARLLAWG